VPLLQCLYLKLPYSNIKGTDPNADYKIYREIEDGKPPATSPDDLNNNMRKLWDHFELCWNTDPQERPSVADVVQFLEENSRRIAEPLSDDLNIPTLSHIREHPVVDLTGRVKDISALPFAGGYSNIWRGTLEDGTLVNGQILSISSLIMSGRSRSSVSEIFQCMIPMRYR
jgi:hypothetical protein